MNPLTKKLAIFLALSLGVNLLLGGFLLGRRFHGPRPEFPPYARGPGMLRGHGMGPKKPQWRAFQAANQAARERAAAAFEHEPFDPAALDAAFANLREETSRGQKALHDELVQLATSSDPNRRHDLARAFRRSPQRGGE